MQENTHDIDLYFNEQKHAYTDSRGYSYTSMTTVIGKYEEKFDTMAMSKRVVKKKSSQYYGWTSKRVREYWKELNATSLVKGNRVHNYLEDAVKAASGYKLIDGKYINDKIYTVNTMDFINSNLGQLDLEYFAKIGIAHRYPRIYKVIAYFVSQGYNIYSEIGIFDPKRLISGLIDILLLNPQTKEFIILDWKTNKHQLIPYGEEAYKWLSGYFKKDKYGNDTDKFIKTNTFFKYPLNNYQQSHYLTYVLQLSGYSSLVEELGFINKGIVLAHIREEKIYKETDIEVKRTPEIVGKVKTDIIMMDYFKDQMNTLFNHHFENFSNRASELLM